jgi:hypothetical protein
MEIQDLKLDGNAIGGLLLELLGVELTAAGTVCAGCGVHEALGRLDVYCGAGIVVRCCHCEAVMIRIVQGPERAWLDLRGTATLELG